MGEKITTIPPMNTTILNAALLVGAASFFAATVNSESATQAQLDFPSASPVATLQQRVGVTDVTVTYAVSYTHLTLPTILLV